MSCGIRWIVNGCAAHQVVARRDVSEPRTHPPSPKSPSKGSARSRVHARAKMWINVLDRAIQWLQFSRLKPPYGTTLDLATRFCGGFDISSDAFETGVVFLAAWMFQDPLSTESTTTF
jgi:hypothetical protein